MGNLRNSTSARIRRNKMISSMEFANVFDSQRFSTTKKFQKHDCLHFIQCVWLPVSDWEIRLTACGRWTVLRGIENANQFVVFEWVWEKSTWGCSMFNQMKMLQNMVSVYFRQQHFDTVFKDNSRIETKHKWYYFYFIEPFHRFQRHEMSLIRDVLILSHRGKWMHSFQALLFRFKVWQYWRKTNFKSKKAKRMNHFWEIFDVKKMNDRISGATLKYCTFYWSR